MPKISSIFLTFVSWSNRFPLEKLQVLSLINFSLSPVDANKYMIETRMQTQQIQAVEANLQHIEEIGEIHRTLVPWYIFTNDSGYGNLFPYIHDVVAQQKPTGKLRVSLLSGTGGLLSLAPELPSVDLFLIFDNNHFVPEAMLQARSALQSSINNEDFIENFSRTSVFQEIISKGNDPWKWLEIEKEAIGEHHFLFSQERILASRTALTGRPISKTIGNFTHAGYLDSLSKALQVNDAEIVHAHFTDVTDWHPEILATISSLPFREDAAITWSTNQGRPDESPLAQLSVGLANYVQDASRTHTVTDYFRKYEK